MSSRLDTRFRIWQAAQTMLRTVGHLSADDLVIALISGGGSAALALPMAGLSLEEKQRITHQSSPKTPFSDQGGKLAAAAAPSSPCSTQRSRSRHTVRSLTPSR